MALPCLRGQYCAVSCQTRCRQHWGRGSSFRRFYEAPEGDWAAREVLRIAKPDASQLPAPCFFDAFSPQRPKRPAEDSLEFQTPKGHPQELSEFETPDGAMPPLLSPVSRRPPQDELVLAESEEELLPTVLELAPEPLDVHANCPKNNDQNQSLPPPSHGVSVNGTGALVSELPQADLALAKPGNSVEAPAPLDADWRTSTQTMQPVKGKGKGKVQVPQQPSSAATPSTQPQESAAASPLGSHATELTLPMQHLKGKANGKGKQSLAPPPAPPPPATAKGKGKAPLPPSAAKSKSGLKIPSFKAAAPVSTPAFGKKIYWRPVPSVDGTIFDGLEAEAGMPDTPLLEAMFADTSVRQTAPVFGAAVAQKRVCLLSPKTAQNLAIALRKVLVEPAEICEQLREFRLDQSLTEEDVELLLRAVPAVEELKAVAEHRGPDEDLRDVDLAAKMFSKVPRVHERLRLVLSARAAGPLCDTLHRDAQLVRCACDELRSSPRLRKVLGKVLLLGNYLNHGTAASERGEKGFSVESLQMLRDFRGNNTGASAVTYLCVQCWQDGERFRDLLNEELQHVSLAASRVSSEGISQQMDRLQADANFFTRELNEAEKATSEAEVVEDEAEATEALKRLRAHHARIQSQLGDALADIKVTLQVATDCQKYFGVTAIKGRPPPFEQLFSAVAGFLTTFSESWDQVAREPERWSCGALSAKRRSQSQPASAARRASPHRRPSPQRQSSKYPGMSPLKRSQSRGSLTSERASPCSRNVSPQRGGA